MTEQDEQERAWLKGWRPSGYRTPSRAEMAFAKAHPGWAQAAWAHPEWAAWADHDAKTWVDIGEETPQSGA